MTKEEVTNFLFNEISSIESAEFRGAELSYNRGMMAWVVGLRVKFISATPLSEIVDKFKDRGIELKPHSVRYPDVFKIRQVHKDLTPKAFMGKI